MAHERARRSHEKSPGFAVAPVGAFSGALAEASSPRTRSVRPHGRPGLRRGSTRRLTYPNGPLRHVEALRSLLVAPRARRDGSLSQADEELDLGPARLRARAPIGAGASPEPATGVAPLGDEPAVASASGAFSARTTWASASSCRRRSAATWRRRTGRRRRGAALRTCAWPSRVA